MEFYDVNLNLYKNLDKLGIKIYTFIIKTWKKKWKNCDFRIFRVALSSGYDRPLAHLTCEPTFCLPFLV